MIAVPPRAWVQRKRLEKMDSIFFILLIFFMWLTLNGIHFAPLCRSEVVGNVSNGHCMWLFFRIFAKKKKRNYAYTLHHHHSWEKLFPAFRLLVLFYSPVCCSHIHYMIHGALTFCTISSGFVYKTPSHLNQVSDFSHEICMKVNPSNSARSESKQMWGGNSRWRWCCF